VADDPANAVAGGSEGAIPVEDERLLEAARRVLADAGWEGLTVEAVAESAGLSRVTAWRLGASREALVATLLSELDRDYRAAMWPVLVADGNARDRLDAAVEALFDVVDAHLPLLLASDTIFHRASSSRASFNEPFIRLFRDGIVDRSLLGAGDDPEESADFVFNALCWPYVHLRGRHGWTAERARRRFHDLIAHGLLSPAPSRSSA
jgi:AcrR family transcriptional regulator